MKRTSSPLQKEVHASNQPATALQLQSFRARGIPRYNVQPVLFAPRGPARREGDVRVAAWACVRRFRARASLRALMPRDV